MAALAPPRPAAPRLAAPPSRLARLADPRRVLALAAALAAFAACVDVLGDPDLFWHLRLGRWILDNHAVPHAELFSFTAAGSPMTAHEWGSEVLFTLLAQAGGLLLVALAMGLVAWSALVALGLRSRQRGASAVAIAVALLVGARAAEPVLGTRPQVITVALVCWTLLIAEQHLSRGGRLVWVLAPVSLVWANLHAGFVLGVGALALTGGLEAVRRWLGRPGAAPWRRIETLALSVGAAALLACLNPNGPGLYRYAMETSSSERAKPITEWQMPNFADPSNIGLLFLMVSFGLLIAFGGRVNLRDMGLAVAGFAAALMAVRNTSLAVALALPAWTAMLQQVLDRLAARRRAGRAMSPRMSLAAAGILVVLGAVGSGAVVARAASDASPSGVSAAYPSCAASALHGVDGVRVLAPYYASGYLVQQLWPRGRVFIYGESASLGTAVFDDYQRIYAGGPDALDLLQSRAANAVLTGPGALHDRLAQSWRRVLDDRSGVTLYVNADLAGRALPASC